MNETYNGYLIPPSKAGKRAPIHRCKREEFWECVDAVCDAKMSRFAASKKLGLTQPTFNRWFAQLVFNGIEPPDYLFED